MLSKQLSDTQCYIVCSSSTSEKLACSQLERPHLERQMEN